MSQLMNHTHLETLLAIVDEGSFEYAALALGVSPSAVSQRIKALEAATGRILLRRATPVTATDAGEVLVQAARRMALVRAEADARLSDRLARIPLAVAVNSDSLATWFPAVFHEMARRGDAALRIRVEDEDRTLSLLRRGDVLGAVTREAEPVSGCVSMPLGPQRYLAVAAPHLAEEFTHSGGTGHSDSAVQWRDMPLVGFGPRDESVRIALRERGCDIRTLRGRLSHIPTSEGYLEAVRSGLGWGLVTTLQAEPFLRSGELVRLDDQVTESQLHWQCWRLESEVIQALSAAVLAAAAPLHSSLEHATNPDASGFV